MLLGKCLTTEAPVWLFCASKWAWEQRITQNFSHFCRRDFFFFCPDKFWIAEITWWVFNIYIGKENLDLHVGQVYVARKTWFVSIKYFSFTSGFLSSSWTARSWLRSTRPRDCITFVFPNLILAERFTVFSMIGGATFEIPLLWLYGFFFCLKASWWTWTCGTGWQIVDFILKCFCWAN